MFMTVEKDMMRLLKAVEFSMPGEDNPNGHGNVHAMTPAADIAGLDALVYLAVEMGWLARSPHFGPFMIRLTPDGRAAIRNGLHFAADKRGSGQEDGDTLEATGTLGPSPASVTAATSLSTAPVWGQTNWTRQPDADGPDGPPNPPPFQLEDNAHWSNETPDVVTPPRRSVSAHIDAVIANPNKNVDLELIETLKGVTFALEQVNETLKRDRVNHVPADHEKVMAASKEIAQEIAKPKPLGERIWSLLERIKKLADTGTSLHTFYEKYAPAVAPLLKRAWEWFFS
jgi:hypothetical protein